MKINIGNIEVGDGYPPFIIAEVGSNWTSLEDCLHSINQAKLCGADAVKFQLFDHQSLYGKPWEFSGEAHGQVTYQPGRDWPYDMPGSLPKDWLPQLKAECDRVGIEFMCSAFSPELVEVIDPFVNVHKVASAECTHKRMLETLMRLRKPVVLSTGAHGAEDISRTLQVLGDTPTILLYCVAAYPANEIHLDGIHHLKQFGTLVGYSDHSADAFILPKAAVNTGACVIEKHVTFIESVTPDSPHSLNSGQFKGMVDMIRGRFKFKSGPTTAEKPMILRHNRRLLAMADIAVGDTLQEGVNFGIYRSLKDDTHAFSPFLIDEVNGHICLKDIKAGDGIGPGDV